MAFGMPPAPPMGAPPMRTAPSIAGGGFGNPAADAVNKKRKKYQQNPSMGGLKNAAANSPKPFNSEAAPVGPPKF
jgi:hypothetical protein